MQFEVNGERCSSAMVSVCALESIRSSLQDDNTALDSDVEERMPSLIPVRNMFIKVRFNERFQESPQTHHIHKHTPLSVGRYRIDGENSTTSRTPKYRRRALLKPNLAIIASLQAQRHCVRGVQHQLNNRPCVKCLSSRRRT